MLGGKTALVTGSIIGIGNATAHALAAEGCNIMMCGLGTPDEVEAARAAIEAEHGVQVKFSTLIWRSGTEQKLWRRQLKRNLAQLIFSSITLSFAITTTSSISIRRIGIMRSR